jgi:hypothetical protein
MIVLVPAGDLELLKTRWILSVLSPMAHLEVRGLK